MSQKPQRSPNNAFRAVDDDGGLVVNPIAHDVTVLNPVGSLIYSMLNGENTVEQIVTAVTEQYEVNESEARRDVDAFIEDLQKRGMLLNGDGPA